MPPNVKKKPMVQRQLPSTVKPAARPVKVDEVKRLSKLRVSVAALEAGQRKKYREYVEELYEGAVRIADSEDLFLDFARQPEWSSFKGKKPRPDRRDEALAHVVRFVVGFEGEGANQRVSKIRSALQPYFDRRADRAQVRSALKKLGIEKMYRETAASRRKESTPTAEPVVALHAVRNKAVDALLAAPKGSQIKVKIQLGRLTSGGARIDVHKARVITANPAGKSPVIALRKTRH